MPAEFQKVESGSIKLNSAPLPKKLDAYVRLISQYGALTPPVVGDIGGEKSLLYGDCELRAMIELNTGYAETMVVPLKDKTEAAKLSLMLMEMKPAPDAISEGELISGLVESGAYTQSQIAVLLGKSVSWVNKRVSLVTRLAPEVREMVLEKRLSPQTAQEIAKMPESVQGAFSSKVVSDRIPKSVVESLVSAYIKADCPDDFRSLVLDDPVKAIGTVQKKTDKALMFGLDDHGIKPNDELSLAISACNACMSKVVLLIAYQEPAMLIKHERSLKQLFTDISATMQIIGKTLDGLRFPQGKHKDFLGEKHE